MATYSFDIVSDYDKAEMNNVFASVQKEVDGRYDFRGTPAAIEWLEGKKGYKLIGANTWQCETLLDIVRKKIAARDQSTKVLDTTARPIESNLKATWTIPFRSGLSQDNAKLLTKIIRDALPKLKPTIQGDSVRVSGSSKDELQQAIALLRSEDFDFALQFINFR